MKEHMEQPMEAPMGAPKKSKWIWWVLLIVVIAVAGLWATGSFGVAMSGSSEYQAVFLTNDQVYFGKLSRADSQYPVLRDVFYLQVTQALQPSNPSTNVNLVKLGGELHGPQDAMYLNRDQVIFFEDLKDDSQVVKAIRQYQEQQTK